MISHTTNPVAHQTLAPGPESKHSEKGEELPGQNFSMKSPMTRNNEGKGNKFGKGGQILSSSNGKYPSYMMKPNWHGHVLNCLQEKGKSETIKIYEGLFCDLPEPNEDIKRRLESIGEGIKKKQPKRELKPEMVERRHKLKYEAAVRDSSYKPCFFSNPSKDLQNSSSQYQSIIDEKYESSDLVKLAMSSATVDLVGATSRVMGFSVPSTQTNLKTAQDFEADLKRKQNEKESIVGECVTLESEGTASGEAGNQGNSELADCIASRLVCSQQEDVQEPYPESNIHYTRRFSWRK